MNRYNLLKKVGSIQQLAFVRPITYEEGKAKHLKAYDIKNGSLRFQVLADKCMDIGECSYKGINLSFLAKAGLTGNVECEQSSSEPLRSLMGGLLFTCGLDNTCLPCTVAGKDYSLHGSIRNTPAEHLSADASWQDDSYKLRISGEMREASLFGNNMTLKRSIETVYGTKEIKIIDIIENLSYQEQPMMILYHFNIGYPLLDKEARVLIPTKAVVPRDDAAKKAEDLWDSMEAAIENEPERVYLHELASDKDGNTKVCLINESIGLGIQISFNKKYLPRFVQWKTLAAGDYAMGLEPTNAGVYGRAAEGEQVHKIRPFEKEVMEIKVTILDGEEEIRTAENEIKKLTSKQKEEER